jgi:hypothetical protein
MFSSARSTKKTVREHKHTFPPQELAWNKAVGDFNRFAYYGGRNSFLRSVHIWTKGQNIERNAPSYPTDKE